MSPNLNYILLFFLFLINNYLFEYYFFKFNFIDSFSFDYEEPLLLYSLLFLWISITLNFYYKKINKVWFVYLILYELKTNYLKNFIFWHFDYILYYTFFIFILDFIIFSISIIDIIFLIFNLDYFNWILNN